MCRITPRSLSALLTVLSCCHIGLAAERGIPAQIANDLQDTGGFVVLVDCPDTEGLLELARNENLLIQCLLSREEDVQKLRRELLAAKLHGRVSVARFDGRRLPYVNGLVTRLVVPDATGDQVQGLSTREVMRVLSPYGKVYAGNLVVWASMRKIENITDRGKWVVATKPYPTNQDEWTHWLHGPDNNAVSTDKVVGVSRNLQWVQPPLWTRNHNLVPGVSAMVSANGRIFTIIDEAHTGIGSMPDRWKLVARDAFNGMPLWSKPIEDWGWEHWSDKEYGVFMRFKNPHQVMRRLVAVGDKVYVTPGYYAPVHVLDGATGKHLARFKGTEKTFEINYHEGLLILAQNRSLGTAGKVPEVAILGVDAETGAIRWRSEGYRGITPKADRLKESPDIVLTIGDDKVFCIDRDRIVCLDRADGTKRWQAARPKPVESRQAAENSKRKGTQSNYWYDYYVPDLCTLVYSDGVLFFSQMVKNTQGKQLKEATLAAFDAETGKPLWDFDCCTFAHLTPPDVFVVDGLVWTLQESSKALVGLEPRTGRVKRTHPVADVFWVGRGHHKCWRNKATETYLLAGRLFTEFVDFQSGETTIQHWVKGHCRYGFMPANGMLYFPSHNCGCFPTLLLKGFLALSSTESPKAPAVAPLEKGPAFGQKVTETDSRRADWPTYRRDNRRTGSYPAALPVKLAETWNVTLGGNLTPPTIAGGNVYVADRDAHVLYGLDEQSGKVKWSTIVGGRIDTPPSYAEGRVVFGARDGYVYCLRAETGDLIWKFRAAPDDLRVVAFGQIESAWPVFGSVLIEEGTVYCTAGRSSNLDGGITAYALRAETGQVLRTRKLAADLTSGGERGGSILADVLVSDGDHLRMRGRALNKSDLAPADSGPKSKQVSVSGSQSLKLYGGFTDDTWFNANFWVIGKGVGAHLVVFDAKQAYGIRPYKSRALVSYKNDVFRPATTGYQLLSWSLAVKDSAEKARRGKSAGKKDGGTAWSVQTPLRAQSMLLADNALYLAGTPDKVDKADPWKYIDGRGGGVLAVHSKTDGRKLAEHNLTSPPVYDGLAASDGSMFVVTKSGAVIRFAE